MLLTTKLTKQQSDWQFTVHNIATVHIQMHILITQTHSQKETQLSEKAHHMLLCSRLIWSKTAWLGSAQHKDIESSCTLMWTRGKKVKASHTHCQVLGPELIQAVSPQVT